MTGIATFWSHVAVGDPDDCWLWLRSSGSHGYGQTWDGTTVRLAHRIAWELTHGPIPNDLTIDHVCRVRTCCNPAHLRLLSNLANASDNGQARRTHCPQGHEYTKENTYVRTNRKGPSRSCRICMTARNKARC